MRETDVNGAGVALLAMRVTAKSNILVVVRISNDSVVLFFLYHLLPSVCLFTFSGPQLPKAGADSWLCIREHS